VRRFLTTTVCFPIAAMLAGCASKQYSPLTSPPAVARILEAPAPEPEIIVLPDEPGPVVGLDDVDAGIPMISGMTNAPSTPSAIFGKGWIPLRTWSERSALGSSTRLVSGGVTAYRVTTRNGLCVLTIGSRLARWNGMTVWLGFAPQIIHGEPHIHALDAEKTLAVLADMTSIASATGRTVVLDPGHGGGDSGTRGAHNELEKNYTLDWALRIERLLTNAGWKVFLTRRTDGDSSLPERVAFADRAHADLFISLHFNSTFPQTQPTGIETYCLTPAGMPSTLARGYADNDHALFPNNGFDLLNMQWAFRIHRALLSQTHAHDDGIKRARFMGVLRYQQRPAILIEGGFLSNLHDAANIRSESYRESLARAVAEALK
jgi:N-acetylmuramoyl-L-alanine amidase